MSRESGKRGISVVVRPTIIQPSSTAFRFEVLVSSKEDVDVLKPLFPEEKLEVGRTYEYHSTLEVFPLHVLEALLHFGARARLYETIFTHSPVEATISGFNVAGYAFSIYMVVLDLNGKCPLGCPWCYASPSKSHGFRLDAESLEKSLIRTLREVLADCKLREHCLAFVTLAIGGSGDPSAMEPGDLEKLLLTIGSALETVRQEEKLLVNLAFSTSDPAFISDDTLRVLLDSAPVQLYDIEMSVSYKTPSERSLIPPLKEEGYPGLVARALRRALDTGFHVSMQLMLRSGMPLEEAREVASIAREVTEHLEFWDSWNRFRLFLLRYYSVPWFSTFKPPSRDEAAKLTLEIAGYFDANHLTFDTCLATQLFERPLYTLEKGRLWRVNLENGLSGRIEGCPRGRDCQVWLDASKL